MQCRKPRTTVSRDRNATLQAGDDRESRLRRNATPRTCGRMGDSVRRLISEGIEWAPHCVCAQSSSTRKPSEVKSFHRRGTENTEKNNSVSSVSSVVKTLLQCKSEQLVERLRACAVGERRGVLEAAVERVVVADGGVVDAEGGVDRRGDILGADVAIAAPPVVGHFSAGGVGRTDHLRAADAAAGPDGGHAQVVIAAVLVVQGADGAAEFGDDD